MSSDEMIWQVINHQFCSYKSSIGSNTKKSNASEKVHFCKHPYSVTGLCNRTSCPLANSQYATLREDQGRVYLCIKTVERAHTPKYQWEKVLLSRNYSKALAQIDEHLQFFPKVLMHRNKQRLTKIHQYLIRMRKLELQVRSGKKANMVRVHRKVEQREERRERKALIAAKITKNLETELVQRLTKGTYGDIYNFPETAYKKVLEQAEEQEEQDNEQEEETEMESEDEESMEGMVEYVEDLDSDEEEEEEEDEEEDIDNLDYLGNGQWGRLDSDNDDDDDDEDTSEEDGSSAEKPPAKKKPSKSKKPQRLRGPRIEIEYEEEREDGHRQQLATNTSGEHGGGMW